MFEDQHDNRMCRRGDNWFYKSHFISACSTLGIGHMLTDIWTLGRCFFVWFCGLGAVTVYICRRENNLLCKPYFIFTLCTFRICAMPTKPWTVGPCISVWFYCLTCIRLIMRRPGNNWLGRFHLMFAICDFEMCHMHPDIWTIERATFVRFMLAVLFMRTWARLILPVHEKLILFLSVMFSELATYSLLLRCCEGACCFCRFFLL